MPRYRKAPRRPIADLRQDSVPDASTPVEVGDVTVEPSQQPSDLEPAVEPEPAAPASNDATVKPRRRGRPRKNPA